MLDSINGDVVVSEVIQPEVEQKKNKNISYRGTDFERTPSGDSFDGEKKNNTGKIIGIIAGVLAAAALTIGAICYSKGKGVDGVEKKFGERMKDGWRELWHKGEKSIKNEEVNVEKPAEEVKEEAKIKTEKLKDDASVVEQSQEVLDLPNTTKTNVLRSDGSIEYIKEYSNKTGKVVRRTYYKEDGKTIDKIEECDELTGEIFQEIQYLNGKAQVPVIINTKLANLRFFSDADRASIEDMLKQVKEKYGMQYEFINRPNGDSLLLQLAGKPYNYFKATEPNLSTEEIERKIKEYFDGYAGAGFDWLIKGSVEFTDVPTLKDKLGTILNDLKNKRISHFKEPEYGKIWTLKDGTNIKYEKIENISYPEYYRIITRNNGSTVKEHYCGDWCCNILEESPAGKMETDFSAMNFSKTCRIQMNDGRSLSRTTQVGALQADSMIDVNKCRDLYFESDKAPQNDDGTIFNKLVAEIRNI